jgi:hypothetical protein
MGKQIIALKNHNNAVAGVIEALLLVALFAIVLSTIQLVYIPEIMEQREADHMDVVENQFSYLKSIIDLQSSLQEDVLISSPIALGSRELPYFVTARAFGHLNIIDGTSSKIDTDFVVGVPLTSIKFESVNSYYVNQELLLEGGCFFIKQGNGETVRIEPSLSYTNQTTQIRINWTLPAVYSIAGKNSSSGFKNNFIRTNYSSTTSYQGSTTYIRIYTDYLDAWNYTMNSLLEEPVSNGYISVSKYPAGSPVYVLIAPGSKTLYLNLALISIGAQIGPGIVL